MTDFIYRGVPVTDNWPAASLQTGANRPSYERWTATFNDLTQLHGNTQKEIRGSVTAHLQEVGK